MTRSAPCWISLPACPASAQRHGAERRAGRQGLPDRLQAEAPLERRVDVKAAAVHRRPPSDLQDLHRRDAEQHGLDRDDVRAGTAFAPALGRSASQSSAVVGGEGELRGAVTSSTRRLTFVVPRAAAPSRRSPAPARPRGSAAASAAPGRPSIGCPLAPIGITLKPA